MLTHFLSRKAGKLSNMQEKKGNFFICVNKRHDLYFIENILTNLQFDAAKTVHTSW